MKKSIFLISILFIFAACGTTDEDTDPLMLADFKFDSILGWIPSDSSTVYCLLGTGFFLTERSDDSRSQIDTWINEHPNAIVMPVSSFGSSVGDSDQYKMVYCWVIDEDDTLNNFLIKEGCFPGGTMMRPETWDEMEDWERELYESVGEEVNIEVHVTDAAYEAFLDQIKSVENFAENNKLGIWKE